MGPLFPHPLSPNVEGKGSTPPSSERLPSPNVGGGVGGAGAIP